jgi:copper chaperone CopZ
MAKNQVELNIGGMTCQGCVRSVEKKLSSVPGVALAQVDLATGKAVVDYDDAVADPANLVGAVEQIGFQASQT